MFVCVKDTNICVKKHKSLYFRMSKFALKIYIYLCKKLKYLCETKIFFEKSKYLCKRTRTTQKTEAHWLGKQKIKMAQCLPIDVDSHRHHSHNSELGKASKKTMPF